MSTSDRLKVQADLLIAVGILRRVAPALPELARDAETVEMRRVAEAAEEFVLRTCGVGPGRAEAAAPARIERIA